MAVPDVTSPYNYRRAVLHAEAQPASMGAPDLGEIAGQHAAGQAKIAAQDQALESDLSFASSRLAERDRQFSTRLQLDRDRLEAWGEQNRWATAIAVANLGLQGLAIPVQQKRLETQDALLGTIAEKGKANVGKVNASLDKQLSDTTKEIGDRKDRNAAALKGIAGEEPVIDLSEAARLRRMDRGI